MKTTQAFAMVEPQSQVVSVDHHFSFSAMCHGCIINVRWNDCVWHDNGVWRDRYGLGSGKQWLWMDKVVSLVVTAFPHLVSHHSVLVVIEMVCEMDHHHQVESRDSAYEDHQA